MATSDEPVPVIDISDWGTGSATERAAIARQLDAACRRTGFQQIVGHGVDADLRRRVKHLADEFFARPMAEKLRYVPPSPEVNRGYAPSRSESLGYSLGAARPPDLVEAFIIGADDLTPGDPYYEAEKHRAFVANIWPSAPAEFRDVYWAYFKQVQQLAHVVTDIVALALGLPDGFFEPMTDKSIDTLRANWYERRSDEPDPVPDQMRLGAHTDYGILTLLMADPIPGLQVLTKDRGWLDVLPLEEAFVLNIGDALAVWTNDEWQSTLHRVVPPPASGGTAKRRSFAFFHDGNYDAVIECLPGCCSPQRPPKYAPITLGQHVHDKLRGGRALVDLTSAVSTLDDRTL